MHGNISNRLTYSTTQYYVIRCKKVKHVISVLPQCDAYIIVSVLKVLIGIVKIKCTSESHTRAVFPGNIIRKMFWQQFRRNINNLNKKVKYV